MNEKTHALHALLFALLVGAGCDLVMGGWRFEHGSLLSQLPGLPAQGFGWEFLSAWPAAWITALVISYFGDRSAQASPMKS